jgi:hypothetical protein
MLLKAYLATCAGFYISRGNGPMPIEEFYAATGDRLTAPPAVPAPPGAKRKPLSAPGGQWGRIIANSIAYPEEHLPKTVRSLAVFATRWGGRPTGYFAGGGEDGLEGREALDGDTLCPRREPGSRPTWLGTRVRQRAAPGLGL